MNIRRLGRLTLKELRETLRDRRTIVTLVLMPLLVYPLLTMALNRYLLSAGPVATGYVVGVDDQQIGDWVGGVLRNPLSAPPPAILESSGGRLAEFKVVLSEDMPAREALEANQLDLAVESSGFRDGGPIDLRVIAYAGDEASLSARRILIERLQWARLAEAEAASGLDAGPVIEAVVVGGTDEPNNPLALILPLVLVLMTITGAVYPAIDLTAGERERGTMEALMASPVPRLSILLAKYVAVVTVAMATATINLVAMYVTLQASGLMAALAQGAGGGAGTLTPMAMLWVLLLLLLFSCFFAALLLSLTSFARSFKEAQAYLIPVMLLSLAPAMIALLPGIELSGLIAVAPLINVVVLARDILAGSVPVAGATVAVFATIVYAGAALAIAASLFGNAAVERTSESSIGSLFRRPLAGQADRDVPGVAVAGLVLAMLVPTSFVVSNTLSRLAAGGLGAVDSGTGSLSPLLWANAAGLILSFGLLPAVVTLWNRYRVASTYRLARPPIGGILGAIIIAAGGWAVAHELIVLADEFGLAVIGEGLKERTAALADRWKTVPSAVLLLTLAVTPAVVEEAFFRGFLFSSLRGRIRPAAVIVSTAVLFGLFHVFVGQTLLIERFLPTTFLGLLLGWVAHRTGSVLPGMLLHFLHNAMLELAAKYQDRLDFLGGGYEDSSHLPPLWLAVTAGLLLVGLATVAWSTRRST